jgi:hypothetical protein
LDFAVGAPKIDVVLDWGVYSAVDGAAPLFPPYCETLENEKGFGALEETGG